MKKVIVVLSVIFGAFLANAQTGFQGGVDVGFPIGKETSNVVSFNLGVNLAYSYAVSDQFDIGVQSGYDAWLGKEYTYTALGVTITQEAKTLSYIPLSALFAFHINDKLYLGGNVGYAIGIDKDSGGFLYQPKVGYNAESFNLYLFYKGISQNGGSLSSLGVGFMYKF